MTANQIANRRAEEEARHNKEAEKEASKKRKSEAVTSVIGSIANVASRGLSSLISRAKKNDPSWYNLDKQLVADTASVSYGTAIGAMMPDLSPDNQPHRGSAVMTIQFMPTLAKNLGTTGDSSVNIAAKNIYGYVRHANSGSRNYDSPDLMLYLLAMDNAYMWISFLKRVYSLALTAKGQNYAYPRIMLKACGVDPDNVINNLAQFRAMINVASMKLNSFYVPAEMPLFTRHSWLVGNIFKDSEIKKSQEYMFNPQVIYIYDDVNGRLNPRTAIDIYNEFSNPLTVANLTTITHEIINALVESEDIGIMSGDILKAYGEGNLIYLESMADDFHIESVYNPEILSQITNAELAGIPSGTIDCTIYQDANGYIMQGTPGLTQPVLKVSPNFIKSSLGRTTALNLTNRPVHILNMYKDNVTPDDTMVASRLMAAVDAISESSDTTKRGYAQVCGTELALYATIYYEAANVVYALHYHDAMDISNIGDLTTAAGTGGLPGAYCRFDWAPRIRMMIAANQEIFDSMDLANFALVPAATLSAMHSTAQLSLLAVPKLGMKVRTR